MLAEILANNINQPFAVVPALHSVLFPFTHQVTSGYSISLIGDLARGTSKFYLRVAWTSAFKQFFLCFLVISVSTMNPWSVKKNKTYSPRECTQWMTRREWTLSQGHREHSWKERMRLDLLSDWREWASTNLVPGGRDGGS